MAKTYKSILFKLDFIGIIPQLKIFNNNIYKSIFSSIFSVLVICFSIVFGIYSFIEFINQSPMIDYYKANDFATNKIIETNNSFIMLQIRAINCDSEIRKNVSFESFYFSSDVNFSIPI